MKPKRQIRQALSQDRWEQVDQLFAEVLDHPPAERAGFLRRITGKDTALHEEVVALLEGCDEARQVLGESAAAYAAPLWPGMPETDQATGSLPPGSRIGPYRLLGEIGRGGMGEVYLAERDNDQYRRRVALKLVKRGMDTDEILRRFRYERQILATLEHPHIARLYEGGLHDDGRPYLAMEYVAGQPIDGYCDARRLTIEERLALFQAVGKAVQYAHQNLVVHRDLKPSNILVTDDGEVKLLDFGIAKLLADEAPDRSAPITHAGARVMTPEYASPEQRRGEPLTTTSDVYGLGVVLYELLTGHRPYEGARASAPMTDRAFLNQEPTRPSAVVRKTTPRRRSDGTPTPRTPEEVCAARATSPDRLQRRLRGDLDTILLKALRQEPDRRYASAEAFVEDIKRHLAGLPVTARPDTLAYRASKFALRHRGSVVATTVFVVLLAGFLAVLTVQQARTARERDTAEQVAAFLVDLFRASDPFAAEPERLDTLRAPDLLARGVSRVQQDLAGQPIVQARLLNVIGSVYRTVGLYEEARPLLEQAVSIRRSHYPAAHPAIAESLYELGILYRTAGDFRQAEALQRQVLSTRRRALSDDHPRVIETLRELANVLREAGSYAAAETALREALTLQRQRYDGPHLEMAGTLNDLALLLRGREDYAAAEPLAREGLAMHRTILGQAHPLIATNLNVLGSILRNQDDLAGAETAFRESLEMNRQLLGEEHPNVSFTKTHLAELLRDMHRYEEAAALYREVLARARSSTGEEHPGVAILSSLLANVLRDGGELVAAEAMYQEALSLMHRVLPAGHVRIARTTVGLGLCLVAQGRFAEAETALLEGYRLLDQQQFPTGPVIAHLITLYKAWGKPEQAEKYRVLLPDAAPL